MLNNFGYGLPSNGGRYFDEEQEENYFDFIESLDIRNLTSKEVEILRTEECQQALKEVYIPREDMEILRDEEIYYG